MNAKKIAEFSGGYILLQEQVGEFAGKFTVYTKDQVSPLTTDEPDYPLYVYKTEKTARTKLQKMGRTEIVAILNLKIGETKVVGKKWPWSKVKKEKSEGGTVFRFLNSSGEEMGVGFVSSSGDYDCAIPNEELRDKVLDYLAAEIRKL